MSLARLLTCLVLAGLGLTAACDRGAGPAGQEEAGADTAKTATPAATGDAYAVGRISREQAGSAAPDAPFTTLDGERLNIADFAGRPVLVNLWATWCAPCVRELPALQRLAERHPDLALLPVSQDFEGAKAVEPFLVDQDMADLSAYLDPQNAWMNATEAQVLPTSIYYDAEGRELWRVVGEIDWDGEQAEELIAEGL